MKAGNNIIAEFMTDTPKIGSQYGFKILPSHYENIIANKYYDLIWINEENLQYHLSYDWLMPVIYKIADIHFFEYTYKWQGYYSLSEVLTIITRRSNTFLINDINTIWQAVVNWIIWHNKNIVK